MAISRLIAVHLRGIFKLLIPAFSRSKSANPRPLAGERVRDVASDLRGQLPFSYCHSVTVPFRIPLRLCMHFVHLYRALEVVLSLSAITGKFEASLRRVQVNIWDLLLAWIALD